MYLYVCVYVVTSANGMCDTWDVRTYAFHIFPLRLGCTTFVVLYFYSYEEYVLLRHPLCMKHERNT